MGKHGKYRALVGALALVASTGLARAECRQALAIGLDVSGSVDAREYRLQLDGLANALQHPEVRQALLQMPEAPVELAVFSWSGAADPRLILAWTRIEDDATLAAATDSLRRTPRTASSLSTAIGAAMRTGAGLLAQRAGCWRRTLDLTGDGISNEGPRPRDVRRSGAMAGTTVNALVIGDGTPDERTDKLTAYFKAEVLHGPDAFTETATDFDDFERAMVRKLLRELQGLNLADGRQ